MDRIGSLYVDNTTGISYRLISTYPHYADVTAAQAKASEEGRDFTKEDYDAVPLRASYTRQSLSGGVSTVDELPDLAMRVWQPAE